VSGFGWSFGGGRRRRAIARITLADDLASEPEARRHGTMVVAGLRDWLEVCQAGELTAFVTLPSEAVAGLWRDLAAAPSYAALCRRAFGVDLAPGAADGVAEHLREDGVLRTLGLACRLEDLDPRRPDRLPRLFSLDDLGHARGLRWHLTGDLPAVRRVSPDEPSTICVWPERPEGHLLVRRRRIGFPV